MYPWDEFLKVELLDTRGYAFIVLIGVSKLLSAEILLTYTSVKSLFSHTLTNTVLSDFLIFVKSNKQKMI